MALANVALTDTFDTWRGRTNQLVLINNNLTEGSHFTTGTITSTNTGSALNVTAGVVTVQGNNFTSNQISFVSNSTSILISPVNSGRLGTVVYWNIANLSIHTSNTSTNQIASANSVNNVNQLAVAAYANANGVSVGANSYAGFMANSANIASNTYAGFMANSGNNFAGYLSNSSNNWANTKVASVSTGVNAGNVVIGGTTTNPTISMNTVGIGACTYSTGISSLTTDAYGRVVSITAATTGTAGNGTVTSISTGTGLSNSVSGNITSSGTISIDTTVVTRLSANQTFTGGFRVTSYNLGTGAGTITPDPANSNYQYITNNTAFTIAAPTSNCAIDVLVTNRSLAGGITFSGYTAPSGGGGDTYATTNTYRYLLMIRRINNISTYSWKALQ